MSAVTDNQLSPTTGEPVSVVASRNKMAIWLCILSSTTGSVALLVAYSYLWSLNVNSSWAPPNNAWAELWPFWAICAGEVIAGVAMRWGWKGLQKGDRNRMLAGSLICAIVLLVVFVGQIIQIATFPFGPSDGAYASCTFWFAFSNAGWIALTMFLVFGIFNRTLARRLTPGNASHAGLVGMWVIWISGVALLGAIFTTTMHESPNTNAPDFGNFQEP